METTFALEPIRRLLMDFYRVTGHQLGIFDVEGNAVLRCPAQFHLFCRMIQSTAEGRRRCMHCDRQAFRTAQKTGELCTYRCHAGLLEVCAPVTDGGEVISYLMFGHLLDRRSPEQQWEQTRAGCESFCTDLGALREAFDTLQRVDPEYITALSNILRTCVGYIQLQQLVRPRRTDIWESLQSYLAQHLTEKLEIEQIAENFSISVSTLSRVVQQHTGMTAGKWILSERMALAKQYLCNTSLPVAEISAKCGIPDYNYFSRLFRRENGCSPRAFREKNKGN